LKKCDKITARLFILWVFLPGIRDHGKNSQTAMTSSKQDNTKIYHEQKQEREKCFREHVMQKQVYRKKKNDEKAVRKIRQVSLQSNLQHTDHWMMWTNTLPKNKTK